MLLTGLAGRAPELDLLVFQRQSVKSAALYHENFTTSCAGLRPGTLHCRGECSKTMHPGVANSA
jgi:hypothetical protein